MWLVHYCGWVMAGALRKQQTNLHQDSSPSSSLPTLLLSPSPPLLLSSLLPALSSAFPELFFDLPLFSSLLFLDLIRPCSRHAGHHGGRALPRHPHCLRCSPSPSLRCRSLWPVRQGYSETCGWRASRREYRSECSSIKQLCRFVLSCRSAARSV